MSYETPRYLHQEDDQWLAVWKDGRSTTVTYSRERGYPGLFRGEVHAAFYHWSAEKIAAEYGGQCEILDVGCGSGYGTRILWHYGHEVWGVDPDPEAIVYASIAYGEFGTFDEAGLADLSLFPDSIFDCVVSSDSFEHTSDGTNAADELARVLQPGGMLLITTPDAELSGGGNPHHPIEYTPQELANLLGAHGFEDFTLSRFPAWPMHMGITCFKADKE